MSQPISRVLSRTIIHLWLTSPQAFSGLPEPNASSIDGFLFGLAPSGVYTATNCYQSRGALLPHLFTLTDPCDSRRCLTATARTSREIWRFVFCCTSRRLAPPRRYLAPCSVEPGLSSDPVLERRKATKEELGPAIAQLTRAQLSRVQNFAQAASTLVSRA